MFNVTRRSRSDVTENTLADLTDVTLVSDITFRRLYWCDSGNSYLTYLTYPSTLSIDLSQCVPVAFIDFVLQNMGLPHKCHF